MRTGLPQPVGRSAGVLSGGVQHWIDELQAARAKDAELIQRLVDALAEQVQPSLDERFRGEVWYRHMAIIKDAEAAGFTPSE